ncbi:hypothetical protein KIPB_001034 [Kipferlia bialata]|uniref:Uncharacterized protein n=1 Tax=Kipferlia bialata TaxID=797122 RepID=A0A391NIJ1_9EUKA|nr:hypothetical protein KIPB_001034 [Kipferlia bialata]|eukprot:g1034.t1
MEMHSGVGDASKDRERERDEEGPNKGVNMGRVDGPVVYERGETQAISSVTEGGIMRREKKASNEDGLDMEAFLAEAETLRSKRVGDSGKRDAAGTLEGERAAKRKH